MPSLLEVVLIVGCVYLIHLIDKRLDRYSMHKFIRKMRKENAPSPDRD